MACLIFQPKNLQTNIWNENFYHEKWSPLPPPPKRRSLKKFVVLKKCRSVVLAMKAFGTRTTQVNGMGYVKIDLGNGNFTTQREESGRCFNHFFLQFFTFFRVVEEILFFSNISRHFQHILEAILVVWGWVPQNNGEHAGRIHPSKRKII